jgi:hypothetical protein
MYSSTSLSANTNTGIWTNSSSTFNKINTLNETIRRDRPGYTFGGFEKTGPNTYRARIVEEQQAS